LLLAAAVVAVPPQNGVHPDERAAYDALLDGAARAADKTFSGAACDDAKVEVVEIIPWKITDHPDLVVWKERVRVTGCGHSSIENINVGRVGGAPPWRMSTGLPGESLADMTLQQSTLTDAAAAAREGLPSDCQARSLGDIYVAARPGGMDISPAGAAPPAYRKGRPQVTLPETANPMLDKLDLAEGWMEVWPFKFCGNDRMLGVVFIPLRDRTASIHLFLPVWQQIEAHGAGARPAAAPPDQSR
jgi:hypothetical protein